MEYQISMFDEEPLSWIEECLIKGSGFENGKIRIYTAAQNLDNKDFSEFLKKEYGIGGSSIKDGFMDYDSNGLSLRIWKSDYKEHYSWTEVAKKIKRLINIDRYLTDKEKIKIETMQEKIIPIPRAFP